MSFFDELKRRRVFRVASSYAVVAFIVMQLVEIIIIQPQVMEAMVHLLIQRGVLQLVRVIT
jgi:hypothetical protein